MGDYEQAKHGTPSGESSETKRSWGWGADNPKLRALFTAAYLPLDPSKAFERRMSGAMAQRETASARAPRWWSFSFAWSPAVGVTAAALVLLAALGLGFLRGDRHRANGTPPSIIGVAPRSSQHGLGPWPLVPAPRDERARQIAQQPRARGIASSKTGPRPLAPSGGGATRAKAGNEPWPFHRQERPAPASLTSGKAPADDLAFVNPDAETVIRRWASLPRDAWEQVAEQVRRTVPVQEDFIQIPFPRLADASGRQIAAAVRQYRQEAAIVDPRLSRQVTLQLKGVALSELCEQLSAQTGVRYSAGRSIADEKVTIFGEKLALRQVMRAINRLFGCSWQRRAPSSREGSGSEYRYELEQDLKSQLLEEELRNRDANAAILAMDAEMEKLRPHLDLSFEELQQRAKESKETLTLLFKSLHNAGWAGMQLYPRLGPAQRAALAAGQVLVFRPNATNPDLRIPAEWTRPILQSLSESGSRVTIDGQRTRIEDVPGMRVTTVQLKMDRSELGQAALSVRVNAEWPDPVNAGRPRGHVQGLPTDLAIGRSPSLTSPANATRNAALRGQPPFDQRVSLTPQPSCVTLKSGKPGPERPNVYSAAIGQLGRPHVFSGDVWEAVHRATGLPIVADYFTRMHRLDQVTVTDQPLFEALCTVGDAMGVHWAQEDGFLLCRGTSYLWDKLKEVPNRHLQRWIADRNAGGELPLADVIEMASQPDMQLDSEVVSEALGHCWGLREWSHAHRRRRHLRFLATLSPDQLRRALEPQRLPFRELTASQQQAVMELYYAEQAEFERSGHASAPITPEQWSHALIYADYAAAGRYWWERFGPGAPIAMGRTAEDALAAARRIWPAASLEQVRGSPSGHFSAGVTFWLPRLN